MGLSYRNILMVSCILAATTALTPPALAQQDSASFNSTSFSTGGNVDRASSATPPTTIRTGGSTAVVNPGPSTGTTPDNVVITNTPATTPAPPQAALQPPVQAPVQQLTPQPAPASPPETSITPATQTAATTAPAAQPEEEAQATVTNIEGFSSQPRGNTLPVGTGTMPITNPGMNMDINPDLVGGMDANGGEGAAAVPYEVQLQQRMEEIQQQARATAFEQAKKSVLPMEPNEIQDVLRRLKDTQEAVQTPARPAPRAGNVIRTVSTDPSEKPKTIHLSAGNVTTLNIIDITGEPWPIVDIGFGGNFDIKPPEPGGHVIRITPLRDFARGNLVVRLLKMTTPITFSLRSGGETVNYRFDARIPEYGPNAKMPLLDQGIKAIAGDKTTTAFLEGATPTGAEKLTVNGVEASTSAYRFAGALYVRTPLSLLSPAWQSSATSADGMNVYVMEDAPVLLLSDKGNLVRARISEAQKTIKE